MQRADLEHLIRAASAITNEYELVVIGSQSILGSNAALPDELLQSMEADLFPRFQPQLADLIDGAIGEGSPFHDRFGYYAQGVGPETATLPKGWQDRLLKIQGPGTDLKVGWCLEAHDLAVSKLAAGRDKDWPFVEVMLRSGLVDAQELSDRITMTDLPEKVSARLQRWVAARCQPEEQWPGESTPGR